VVGSSNSFVFEATSYVLIQFFHNPPPAGAKQLLKHNNYKILCQPILGEKLLELYPGYLKNVFPNYVSDTPKIAIKKITDYFNVTPSINGNNVSGIVDIRDRLFKLSEKKEFVNAFAIVASHTHWVDRKPIIYHYLKSKNCYIIGTHPINPDSTYHPVSFAFNSNFPLAFEWCEGLSLIEDEYKIAFDLVNNLNDEIQNKNYPIGISIDFRFKKSLFEKPIASVELPIDETGHDFFGYSKIVSLEYFESTRKGEGTEQVAWHPFSDLILGLNQAEMEILNKLRLFVFNDSNNSALSKLNKITNIIKDT